MASSQNQKLGSDVCVVGAGPLGLLALKNLREQGLDARAFERQEHIGGTWHASHNTEQTTALPQTKLNTSKQCVSPESSVRLRFSLLMTYSVPSLIFQFLTVSRVYYLCNRSRSS